MGPIGLLERIFHRKKSEQVKDKEEVMQRKVVFTRTEGLRVKQDPTTGTFSLATPIEQRIGRMGSVAIDLGISCDRPVALCQPRGQRLRGIVFDGPAVFDAGDPIGVVLKNDSNDTVVLELGETVAKLLVLGGVLPYVD